MQPSELIKSQKKALKKQTLKAAGSAMLNAVLLVAQLWLVAHIITKVTFEKTIISELTTEIAVAVVLILLRFLTNGMGEKQALEMGRIVSSSVRNNLLDKLANLGPAHIQPIERGRFSTVMVEGVEKFAKYFSVYLPALTHLALIPVCILVLVFPLDLISALVFVLTAPFIPLFMILIGRGAQRLHERHWSSLNRLSARLQESLRGLQTLKRFGAVRQEEKNIEDCSEQYKTQVMGVLRVAFLSSVTLEFFSTLSIALVAVFIGFRLLSGEMQFQDGFLILLLAPEFYQPLRNLGTNHHVKMEAMAAAEEILKIITLPEPDFNDHRKTLKTDNILDFQSVSFVYPDGHKALFDINFSLQKGETVVITGPSGAGKSTFLNLALGILAPTSGDVFLHGTTKCQQNDPQWFQQISWMSQSPHIFDSSIAHNIALDPDLQRETRIRQVVDLAAMTDCIDRMENELLQRVGEQGRLLSDGEVRRLALARVLLKDAPLLVMDEPSANLDDETEKHIFETLKSLKQSGKTLLIVAHRPRTLTLADRVFHIENGRLSVNNRMEEVA